MKKASAFIFLLLHFCARSYAQGKNEPLTAGKIISAVTCKGDAGQSYALYIPSNGNKESLPIIYFFDPHGDGTFPLKKYQSLAEAHGFILAGSNNSKNGNDWPSTENIWRCISGDTKSRLKINAGRVYTCGFSGGAKVASYVALHHSGIRGVIANGAGLPDGTPAGNFNFSFTAIGGEGDMNFTELISISSEMDRTRTRHRIIIFDGKHEWAPESTMNMAFAGWQFDAMRDGLIPRDNAFISRYIAKSKNRIALFEKSNELINAGQECNLSINLLEGLTPETGWFKQQAASLINNPLYQKQRQAQEALLVREHNTKTEYMQHFQQADMRYWTNRITDLQTKAAVKTNEKAMYQRLLAYLSLAFYSISNHLINSNENDAARQFVELYKMADPTNSEAWYFSAILHARLHELPATESDLLKSVENGFRDKGRMGLQPEFRTINLSRITAALKGVGS